MGGFNWGSLLPLVGGAIGGPLGAAAGSLFSSGSSTPSTQSMVPSNMQYNPYYDQALQSYFQTGQSPAGLVKPTDYTVGGQTVAPGNMKSFGDYSGAMQGQMSNINGQLAAVRAQPLGYGANEIQAMNDTLTRQQQQQSDQAYARMNASAAGRGMTGGSLDATQLNYERDAANANANGRAQILLGSADARMQGQNQQNSSINSLLGIGNQAAGNIGSMQAQQGNMNTGMYNQLADPMRYQEAITSLLTQGGKMSQGVGSMGLQGAQIQNSANAQGSLNDAAYGKGLMQLLQGGNSGQTPWNGLASPTATSPTTAGSPSYSFNPQQSNPYSSGDPNGWSGQYGMYNPMNMGF